MLKLAQRRLEEDMEWFFWLLLCAFVGYAADRKGRSMWAWGIASLFISPLIVGIVLALMPAKGIDSVEHLPQSSDESREDKEQEGKRCPECGYLADAGEQYCPRCGEMLW